MTQLFFQHKDFTVGWICALPEELAAAEAMLDYTHPSLLQDGHDHNTYTLGCIGNHNVVIACLPSGEADTQSAASVLNDMRRSFKTLRFCLMVGIGGAVPGTRKDIRLGDIFVSSPELTSGGVIQYDAGKVERDGELVIKGSLNAPPRNLRTALQWLKGNHERVDAKFPQYLQEIFDKYKKMAEKYSRPDSETEDLLFKSDYEHPLDADDCSECDPDQKKLRKARKAEPRVHFGLIASANKIMKDGATRDRLWRAHGIECFETEAAGLMNSFPCLVIRGISDYADSHKNDVWQPYAAAIAAAYAKELLMVIPSEEIRQMPSTIEMENGRTSADQGVTTSSNLRLPMSSTAIQHSFYNPNQYVITSLNSRPLMPSITIREDVWYHLTNFNSPKFNVDIDNSIPRRDNDVQITLAPENARCPGQYWKCEPNSNAGFWTISNMELPHMALDVYGNNKAHPRLAPTEYVTGQQWQAVVRGNGAVSLWNSYSERGMYLSLSDNPHTPMRLRLSDRDDSNQSQLWFLRPVRNIEQKSHPTNRMISDKPHELEDIMGENKSASKCYEIC